MKMFHSLNKRKIFCTSSINIATFDRQSKFHLVMIETQQSQFCLIFKIILDFRYLWSCWENNKISSLVSGLDKTSLVRGTHDEIDNSKLEKAVENFYNTRGQHDVWAWKFYTCEFLTLANLFFQYFITNRFLQGEDHFQKVALQGWNIQEHVSALPITGLCHIKR